MKSHQRLYQLWPGRNRFWLGGKLILGPVSDKPISAGPYVVFLLVLGLYIYFMLAQMLSSNTILCLSLLTSFLSTITLMLITSFTDPGIIPRRPFLQLLQHQMQQQQSHNSQSLLHKQKYQRLQYLLYQTSDVHQVFCSTCHIYRPQSASHCRECDNCILQLDHHCPWLNNCVGQNNYKWFLLFVFSLIAMMISFACNAILWMDEQVGGRDDGSGKNNEKKDVLLSVFVLVCFVVVGAFMVVIVGFCLFHLFLICKGKTTRQFIKQNKSTSQRGKKNIKNEKQSNKIQNSLNQPLATNQINETLNNQAFNNKKTHQPEDTSTLRRLDDLINSQYQQPSIFYEGLFKQKSSIHFVDFRQKLSSQRQELIVKGLKQLQEKRERQQKQGIPFTYFKRLPIKQ